MRALKGGLGDAPERYFAHPFKGFSTIGAGHHPIEWSVYTMETFDEDCRKVRACLDEACPGLVRLIIPPEIGQQWSKAPVRAAMEMALWNDFFDMALSISGIWGGHEKPRLAAQVPRFYPNLTPAALVPYEREFHARYRSRAYMEAEETADLILAYRDGGLMARALDDDKATLVRHLVREEAGFRVNHERALFYHVHGNKWEQKAGDRARLKLQKKGEVVVPWRRLPTLLAASMRAVCQELDTLSPSAHKIFNLLLQSWGSSEPRTKRARHE